ncbi:MAG: hypothetical protein KDG58_20785, partial [Anaerolineae bacterium]|nr:hypothetical protein [Anaerolineae bacterium]
ASVVGRSSGGVDFQFCQHAVGRQLCDGLDLFRTLAAGTGLGGCLASGVFGLLLDTLLRGALLSLLQAAHEAVNLAG